MIAFISVLTDEDLSEYYINMVDFQVIRFDLSSIKESPIFVVLPDDKPDMSTLITSSVDEVMEYLEIWQCEADDINISIQVFKNNEYAEVLKYLGEMYNVYLKEVGEESRELFNKANQN